MTPEGKIQREVMLTISEYGGVPLRLQSGNFYTKQGDPVKIGVPGLPDVLALMPDGTPVFMEIKTEHGTVREDQKQFMSILHGMGYKAYVVRSRKGAMEILEENGFRLLGGRDS